VTVKQFQNIAEIKAIDDISHMALIVCSLYGYSEDYVDNMKPSKALKLFEKVGKKVTRCEKPLLFFTRKMQTDAFKLTFGQFIEINYWLKSGEIESYHLIAASAIGSDNHKALADKILHGNVRRILLPVRKLLHSYAELLSAYSNLFEIEDKQSEGESEPPHPFIEQYGWLFTAKQVSEHLGLNVNDVYKIGIVEAFNTMAYLKTFNQYQEWQSRKI
jgi:hypothetical protein